MVSIALKLFERDFLQDGQTLVDMEAEVCDDAEVVKDMGIRVFKER